MPTLGDQSKKRLVGVHPDLVAVVKRAMEVTKQDFTVLCGVRTAKEQAREYAKGRTTPGPQVTWVKKSRHEVAEDGYGYAVDIVPYPVDWNTLSKFDAIADAMQQAAKEYGVKIRSGADWDGDGKLREKGESDSPHWEI